MNTRAWHGVCDFIPKQELCEGRFNTTMKTTASSRLVAGALLIGAVSPALAQNGGVQVRLNDQPLALSASPLEVNGRTLLPMRDVFESLGASVNWNPATQSVSAQAGATNILLAVNNSVAFVNGQGVTLDQPAILVGGRAFVPLRFVAQATGAKVDWNAPLQLVSISKPLVSNTARVADYRSDDFVPNDNVNRPDDSFNRPSVRSISVPRDVVVPVQLDQALSSRDSRVGDRFTATVVSHRLGDSEFPAGTKLAGIVTEARPSQGKNAGVLDFAFQTAITPDGTRIPLRARLISFDSNSVSSSRGRLVAKGARKNNDLASAGVGAGAGYVLGRVLGTDSTISTVLGGAGGYLFGRSRDRKAQEARLAKNTTLGVEMLDGVRYDDTNNYGPLRQAFLNGPSRAFDPRAYQADAPAYDAPRDGYDNTPVREELPAPAPLPEDRYVGSNAPDGRLDGNGDARGTNSYASGDSFAQRISVPEGAVIPLRLDQAFSSATARAGDRVSATIDSERLGDSEFPAGTRITGEVVEARPRTSSQPGVLDFDFQTAQLPSGERVPLRGELISLDDKGVQATGGRLVATGRRSSNDRAKVIGIGAAAGFVVGRVLGKNGLLPPVLGALGGYLYGQKNNRTRTAEAVVPRDARLGLRLNSGVNYNGGTYYASRAQYLRVR